MQAMSLPTLGLFFFSMLCQIAGITILPMTRGFQSPLWAVLCVASFALAMFAMARLIFAGATIGILLPLMAATVPLATMVLGIVLYGESASLVKIAALIGACGLIAVASQA